MHLHNIAHQLSPSILDAAPPAGVPVVQTLHDYKLTCPTYLHRTPAARSASAARAGAAWQLRDPPLQRRQRAAERGERARGDVAPGAPDSYDRSTCSSARARSSRASAQEFGVPAERLALVPHFIYAVRLPNAARGRRLRALRRAAVEEKGARHAARSAGAHARASTRARRRGPGSRGARGAGARRWGSAIARASPAT